MTPLTTHILYYLTINLSSYNKSCKALKVGNQAGHYPQGITLNSADYGEIRLGTSPYIMLSSS